MDIISSKQRRGIRCKSSRPIAPSSLHAMGNLGTVYLGRNRSSREDREKSKWHMFWRKISRGHKKVCNASVTSKSSYDPDEYSQNFDPGTGWQEPDNLPRSFSARYADPSRILQKKQ